MTKQQKRARDIILARRRAFIAAVIGSTAVGTACEGASVCLTVACLAAMNPTTGGAGGTGGDGGAAGDDGGAGGTGGEGGEGGDGGPSVCLTMAPGGMGGSDEA